MLTGNKDVDRKILNELEDKDLVSLCQINKQANSLCNDQVFWMNRVFLRFGYVGGNILRKYKGDRTWSEYYIQDLRKINPTNADKYLETGSHEGKLYHVIIALKNGANISHEDFTILTKYYNNLALLSNTVSKLTPTQRLVYPNGMNVGRKDVRGVIQEYTKKLGDIFKYFPEKNQIKTLFGNNLSGILNGTEISFTPDELNTYLIKRDLL